MLDLGEVAVTKGDDIGQLPHNLVRATPIEKGVVRVRIFGMDDLAVARLDVRPPDGDTVDVENLAIFHATVVGEVLVHVVVAAGDQHRGDLFEFIEYRRNPNITEVQDEVDTLEGLLDLGGQYLVAGGDVGVREQSDQHPSSLLPSLKRQ